MDHRFDVVEDGFNAPGGDDITVCNDGGRLRTLDMSHSGSLDEDGRERRNGNVWTATCHVITAVIGSGVLSLAWSMSNLGWEVGPPVLIGFSLVTYYTSLLLADCYRSPDPVTGQRNYTYKDAVKANLGRRQVYLCGFIQYINLVGTAIGYTITASISMVAIARSNCFHQQGRDAPCHISNNPYMAIFGVAQIIFSQIPDLHRVWWLSILAAVMSLAYSAIGLGLGIGLATEKNHSYGALKGTGVGELFKDVDKTWNVFQALGNIAFAYSFSMILIEIQDTIKSPPAENKTMKKATTYGVLVTTFFYMSVGCVGYAAFGNNAPGNLLTGFGFYNPYWLVDIGNICIVIHLVGAYQVFSQPLFAFVEEYFSRKYTKASFIHKEYTVKFPCCGSLKFTLFRLVWRTCFVIFTTMVSMILPFFNGIVGILGALAFFPLTVYFPVEMYIVQFKVPKWSRKWVALRLMSLICLVISLVSLVGSVAGVVSDLRGYKLFKTKY